MLKERLIRDLTENEMIKDFKEIVNYYFNPSFSKKGVFLVEHVLEKKQMNLLVNNKDADFMKFYNLNYKNNDYEVLVMNRSVDINSNSKKNDIFLNKARFELNNGRYDTDLVSYRKAHNNMDSIATIRLNNSSELFRYNYIDYINNKEHERLGLVFDNAFKLEVMSSFDHLDIKNPTCEIEKIKIFFDKIVSFNNTKLNTQILDYLTQSQKLNAEYKDMLNITYDISVDNHEYLENYKMDLSTLNIKHKKQEPKKNKIKI